MTPVCHDAEEGRSQHVAKYGHIVERRLALFDKESIVCHRVECHYQQVKEILRAANEKLVDCNISIKQLRHIDVTTGHFISIAAA